MWEIAAGVVGALFVVGAATRGASVWRRRKGLAVLGDAAPARLTRGVHVRAQIQGKAIRGFKAGRAHRLVADLGLADGRFVVSTSAGVLLDERDGARTLVSARAPGPGRLVLEGEVPTASGTPTLYRHELVTPDAAAWAEALAAFTRG